jgi:hypothetical protein
VLALHGAGFALVGLIPYRVLRLPQDLSNIEAFPPPAHFSLAGLLGYFLAPYLLRLPNGSRSVRGYLDEIRLIRVKPFLPLLLLTVCCDLNLFGLMHLPAGFAGTPPVVAAGQVARALLFGLFYGYIVLKTGSLLPSMVIHWLSNVFQASLTAYFATSPPPVRPLYGAV